MANEDRYKLRIGKKGELKRLGWQSYYVKPSSKFWKRYFNKKVRSGSIYKRGNFFEWS